MHVDGPKPETKVKTPSDNPAPKAAEAAASNGLMFSYQEAWDVTFGDVAKKDGGVNHEQLDGDPTAMANMLQETLNKYSSKLPDDIKSELEQKISELRCSGDEDIDVYNIIDMQPKDIKKIKSSETCQKYIDLLNEVMTDPDMPLSPQEYSDAQRVKSQLQWQRAKLIQQGK